GRYGTTPGKRALGLRVVTVTGRPIGWSEAALRNVLRAADLLPIGYLVGVTSMACTRRSQRLGDVLAGTMVIISQRTDTRNIGIALYPPATPQELAIFPSVVRLDAEERIAIELFLRRRIALGPARAHELASMLIEPLGQRYDFSRTDPTRVLALLYDLAMNAGREDAPPSSRHSAPPPRFGASPEKKAARWP
ncbi:MAG: RDD family protein, partial [Polyangiaceae bacterium]